MTDYDIQICSELLKQEYAKAATRRKKKVLLVRWLIKPGYNVFIDAIAKELGNCRLAKLFIEAQFARFPAKWCLEHFKNPYPSVNVAFGGNCWDRYLEYISEGVREPV